MIARFDRDEAPTTISQTLGADGVVIIDGLFDAELVDRVRTEVGKDLDAQRPGGGTFYGQRAKRLGGLLQLSDAMAEIIAEPILLDVISEILLPNCYNFRLGVAAILENWKGGTPQPLHRDGDIYSPFLRLDKEAFVTVMIAGTDFTCENGGTRVVPGSHQWERTRQASETEEQQLEMRQGSAALWLGSTLHGMAVNHTDGPRMGIVMGYALGWLRQEEEQFLVVTPERARQLPEGARRVLGYQSHGPYLGWVGGNDPVAFEGDTTNPADLSKLLI